MLREEISRLSNEAEDAKQMVIQAKTTNRASPPPGRQIGMRLIVSTWYRICERRCVVSSRQYSFSSDSATPASDTGQRGVITKPLERLRRCPRIVAAVSIRPGERVERASRQHLC